MSRAGRVERRSTCVAQLRLYSARVIEHIQPSQKGINPRLNGYPQLQWLCEFGKMTCVQTNRMMR